MGLCVGVEGGGWCEWTNYGSHTYRISGGSNRAAWDEAESSCVGQGGHLTSVTSQGEHDFLRNLDTENRDTWVGGQDSASGSGRSWFWVDGEAYSYNNWKNGQPTDDTSKNCIKLRKTAEYKFQQHECSQDYQFICKKGRHILPYTVGYAI